MLPQFLPLNNPKGFTLIEILVTIAIVGIISAISFGSYTSVQKSSRDGIRKSDLAKIQSGLQQYYADQSYFPQTITPGSPITSGTRQYLNLVPKDPDGTNYRYDPLPAGCNNTTVFCSNYCLYTNLEIDSSQTGTTSCPQPFPAPFDYVVTQP